jgi:hypothetical protein
MVFEIGFGHGDGESEVWDVDMVESVVSDAVIDGEVDVVPVQE